MKLQSMILELGDYLSNWEKLFQAARTSNQILTDEIFRLIKIDLKLRVMRIIGYQLKSDIKCLIQSKHQHQCIKFPKINFKNLKIQAKPSQIQQISLTWFTLQSHTHLRGISPIEFNVSYFWVDIHTIALSVNIFHWSNNYVRVDHLKGLCNVRKCLSCLGNE